MGRSPLSDGPLQRQIILLKLDHEMRSRPQFGEKFIGSPDSDAQNWLARVGALMDRVGISESVEFKSAMSNSVQYWKYSMDSALRSVQKAIEAIKLELEIYQDDDVGRVFDKNSEMEFSAEMVRISSSSNSSIFVVDPYFDPETFAMMFTSVLGKSIDVLCNKHAEGVAVLSKKYQAQNGGAVRVRRTPSAHDRAIFIDDTDCWVLGASIKDGGKKPTYLMPLNPEMAREKFKIYRAIWTQEKDI